MAPAALSAGEQGRWGWMSQELVMVSSFALCYLLYMLQEGAGEQDQVARVSPKQRSPGVGRAPALCKD